MAQNSAKQNEKEKELRELTAAERKAIDKYLIRSKAKPTVRLKISNNATGAKIQLDHPQGTIGHALLMDVFGSADQEFVNGLLGACLCNGFWLDMEPRVRFVSVHEQDLSTLGR